MWTCGQLKQNGKTIFKRNYWPCVGVSVLLGILAADSDDTGVSSVISGMRSGFSTSSSGYDSYSTGYGMSDYITTIMLALSAFAAVIALLAIVYTIFVGNVISVGGCRYFINNRTGEGRVSDIFAMFKESYGNVLKVMLMRDIFIFLWTLLLIVPGIIKSYEYYLVPYIMADNPGMDYHDALELSKRMMYGQKWHTFVLGLSFIGWDLLSAITLGIVGIFWTNPYRKATFCELYEFSRIQALNEGIIR